MKRTICLKLNLIQQQADALLETQTAFSSTCNAVAFFFSTNRCWNQVCLHHLCYYRVRQDIPQIGAQMVCNTIRKVCTSYKVLKVRFSEQVPTITFRETSSVRYCARTFSLRSDTLCLYTTKGRIRCSYKVGELQQEYLSQGSVKEAELVRGGKRWFFHLVLDIPDHIPRSKGNVVAVDMGENNLATTSYGAIHGGGRLRHQRDRFLNRRKRLQSNGSRSAKRCLKKISGKEKRRVREVNHTISKRIVDEAKEAKTLVMEDLTNIRKRIRGNKRLRSRLHRWTL